MRVFGQNANRLLSVARSAALAAGLCLLALHSVGAGAYRAGPLASSPVADTSFAAAGMAPSASALTRACDGLSCEAVLTNRRLSLVSSSVRCARWAAVPLPRFHNNSRPPLLRTRAIFCDFARLRSILHPQLALLAHASTVLC